MKNRIVYLVLLLLIIASSAGARDLNRNYAKKRYSTSAYKNFYRSSGYASKYSNINVIKPYYYNLDYSDGLFFKVGPAIYWGDIGSLDFAAIEDVSFKNTTFSMEIGYEHYFYRMFSVGGSIGFAHLAGSDSNSKKWSEIQQSTGSPRREYSIKTNSVPIKVFAQYHPFNQSNVWGLYITGGIGASVNFVEYNFKRVSPEVDNVGAVSTILPFLPVGFGFNHVVSEGHFIGIEFLANFGLIDNRGSNLDAFYPKANLPFVENAAKPDGYLSLSITYTFKSSDLIK